MCFRGNATLVPQLSKLLESHVKLFALLPEAVEFTRERHNLGELLQNIVSYTRWENKWVVKGIFYVLFRGYLRPGVFCNVLKIFLELVKLVFMFQEEIV